MEPVNGRQPCIPLKRKVNSLRPGVYNRLSLPVSRQPERLCCSPGRPRCRWNAGELAALRDCGAEGPICPSVVIATRA